ncbi:hypothetical protein [Desulfosporosinus hippei]|nr:hypothetical protein [Desulfosporosinus hippei]
MELEVITVMKRIKSVFLKLKVIKIKRDADVNVDLGVKLAALQGA